MRRTTLLSICLAGAFTGSGVARADLADYQLAVRLEPGLISQYTLDASDLSDDFGSNDGTAQGTVSFTTGVAGGADKAVLLAGDGHVRLQQVPEFDFTDGIYILNYLFLGGPTPPCREAANPNNDLSVNITDGIYVLNFLFLGGPPPAAPGPTGNPCGVDPEPEGSAGDLGCGSYAKC